MSTLLGHARELATQLPTRRAAHEANQQLSSETVRSLRDSGLLAVLAPAELGGHQVTPVEYVDILATLAAGDPATAWCVMTCSTSTLLAPYFERPVVEALWAGRPAPFVAGIFAPMGQLSAEGTLRGRWSWASGSRHAELFLVGALQATASGKRHVVCALRPDQLEILDNWDTLGMRGTGSHDLLVEDARLAPEHITSVFDRRPWTTAPLYRVPLFGLLALGVSACAVGIAQTALAHVKFDDKAPSAALATLGELRATHAAARAYLRDVATTAYAAATSSDAPIDAATRGELRLAATFVASRCAEVVRGAFHLGGGASARNGSLLGAALRDIETLLTHRMVVDRVLPAATRAIIGIGTPPPDL